MKCPACRREFGGSDAYERHLLRREDRCRNAREMQRTNLVYRDGVWHRKPMDPQTTLIDKRRVPRRPNVSGGLSR